jgi:hypothetical protein
MQHSHRYDIVFCFSLFTHLSEGVWKEWFQRLFGLVAPGGHFIVSTHSQELLQRLLPGMSDGASDSESGFVFVRSSEAGHRLDGDVYGTSVVNEKFVRGVCTASRGCQILKRYGKGEFDLYHDVYVFHKRRRSLSSWPGLSRLRRALRGWRKARPHV